MFQFDMYNIRYKYYDHNIYYTYGMFCIGQCRYKFAQYLTNYCTDFNISVIKLADSTRPCNNMYIMNNTDLLSKMNEHEAAILYRGSLRNAWILSCISI